MPVLTNSIGIHAFEDLQGSLHKRGQQLQKFVRAGIDGAGYRLTGSRTGSFELVSIHYVLNWQAAKNAVVAYQLLRAADPVAVVQHSEAHGTYKVIDVQQVEARAVVSVTPGTIVTNPQVRQVCRWVLEG